MLITSKKIFILLLLAASLPLFSQQDTVDLTKLITNQKQWEIVRDYYAVEAIKLLARIDTINIYMDSLKQLNSKFENFDCEKELYLLVGTTKEEVYSYRIKFDETEKRISSKAGTPADARKMYFDEINRSKIKCLPEFHDRLISLQKKLESWEGSALYTEKTPERTYHVVKGDCLWMISEKIYGSTDLWPAIWDANMVSIVNPEAFDDIYFHNIFSPDYIYPGQVLKIPSLTEEEKKNAEERSKEYRRIRNLNN